MGALVFVCPATGLEVPTGLEMDHEIFAALPSVLPDLSCPHCTKPHQLSEVTAWLAKASVELMGPPQARLPLPKIKVFARTSAQLVSRICRRAAQANMRSPNRP